MDAKQKRAEMNDQIARDARLIRIRTAQLKGLDIWSESTEQALRFGLTMTQNRINAAVGKANAAPLALAQDEIREEIRERRRLRLVHEAGNPSSDVAKMFGTDSLAARGGMFSCALDRCSLCAATVRPSQEDVEFSPLPF
jgi:hypothetical protein